jgi:broad specificity phosphatase PhoE
MPLHLILVRHGSHGEVGRVLSGRSDIALSSNGRAEAEAAARRMALDPVRAVLSSPRRRAVETAEPIAAQHGLQVETSPALDEVDFGGWTGRSFAELADEPDWRRWNTARSLARPPSGESMVEAQARMIGLADRLMAGRPDGAVVLVGHAEPLRSLILFALGLGLDAWSRVALDPGSVSRLVLDDSGPCVTSLNEAPS